MLVTTPLSYLDSFGDGVGGQAATHPADLRFVYLSRGWGGPHGQDFGHAGFATSVPPPVSPSFGKLTVGPAQDLKPNPRFPVLIAEQQNSIFFQELGLVSLGVCDEHVSVLCC